MHHHDTPPGRGDDAANQPAPGGNTSPRTDSRSSSQAPSACFDQCLHLYHTRCAEEFRLHGYRTNAIVEVPDSLSEAFRSPIIRVNGVGIPLAPRERIVLFLLAEHCRRLGRQPGSTRSGTAGFLSVPVMLAKIDALSTTAGMGPFWENAIYTDIHRVISDVRAKIAKAGFDRNLVELSRGLGYRLSTPHWNVISPPEDDSSISLSS